MLLTEIIGESNYTNLLQKKIEQGVNSRICNYNVKVTMSEGIYYVEIKKIKGLSMGIITSRTLNTILGQISEVDFFAVTGDSKNSFKITVVDGKTIRNAVSVAIAGQKLNPLNI